MSPETVLLVMRLGWLVVQLTVGAGLSIYLSTRDPELLAAVVLVVLALGPTLDRIAEVRRG